MMLRMVSLALRELRVRWRTTVGMVAGVGIALLSFLALEGITNGAAAAFSTPPNPDWVVQQPGSLGEFIGSRLPGGYGSQLKALGAELVVKEIHAVTGPSFADVLIVRGVETQQYRKLTRFTLRSGHALAPEDRGVAMAGASVAAARGWKVGDHVTVRGHAFPIKGIFRIGTIADSEVWLPLPDAQEVLGLGDDVSIYVVRGDQGLPRRIEAAFPVEVAQQGEGFLDVNRSLRSIVRVLRVATGTMAVAAGLSILTVMFSVVRTRRRQLAILRSIGFGRAALLVYVLAQAVVVAVIGYALALGTVVALLGGMDLGAFGLSIRPLIDTRVAATSLALSVVVALLAVSYPAALAARLNIAETLRME